MRAQVSLEFLFWTAAALIILSISTILFAQSESDASALASYVEMKRLCYEIAAQISTVDGGGNGTVAVLMTPVAASHSNYTIFVSGAARTISVSDGKQGVGCALSTTSASNGTSSSFYVRTNSIIRNTGAGVTIG